MVTPLRCRECGNIPDLRTVEIKDKKAVWIQCNTCGIRTTWFTSNRAACKAWRFGFTFPLNETERIHPLKLRATFFEDVRSGIKSFEVRKNDRDYRVGDLLEFYRVNEDETKDYDVRFRKRVCYILTHENFPQGIPKDYVILGLKEV